MSRELTIRCNNGSVTLEEGDTVLTIMTGDPNEARQIYEDIAREVRKKVAMVK